MSGSGRGAAGGGCSEPLTEVEMAVIDAALAEELAEFLELPAELLVRYRAQVAGRGSAEGDLDGGAVGDLEAGLGELGGDAAAALGELQA